MATDDFNRANGGLGANWGNQTTAGGFGAPAIASNVVTGADQTNEAAARYTATTFSADQYSQCVVAGFGFFGADTCAGPTVRGSADQDTGRDYYWYKVEDTGTTTKTHRLVKLVNGTETSLANSDRATSNGDTLRIEVTGSAPNVITCWHNGTQVSALDTSETNATLATGQPGIAVTQTSTVDTWEGGDLVTITIIQEGFRFATDSAQGSPSWLAAQNANLTKLADETAILAVSIDTTGDPGAKTYKLQYRKVGDPTWLDVTVQ